MGDLTANFSRAEFACKCGQCDGADSIGPDFVRQLQIGRELSDCSYTITSGFRCSLHPETKKRSTSSHPKGVAADIATPHSQRRYNVLKGLIGAGFTRLGIGKTFIHVDQDLSKPPYLIWDYYD